MGGDSWLRPRHQWHNRVSVTPIRLRFARFGALAEEHGRRAVWRARASTRGVYVFRGWAAVSRNAPASHDLRGLASASRRQGVAAWYESEVLCLKMRENGRKWPKTCKMWHDRVGHTPTGALGRRRAERSRSRVSRRACTITVGLHVGGRLDASSRPVCAPSRDS